MQPQLSDEEVARLEALQHCHVLDTPREEIFDQIALLAAYLCGTPIGLIGFIDGDTGCCNGREIQQPPNRHTCWNPVLRRGSTSDQEGRRAGHALCDGSLAS